MCRTRAKRRDWGLLLTLIGAALGSGPQVVRGANRHGASVHLAGLARHDTGRVLGQVQVATTSDEIAAAPALHAGHDLSGMVVTLGALPLQRPSPRSSARRVGRPDDAQGGPAGAPHGALPAGP